MKLTEGITPLPWGRRLSDRGHEEITFVNYRGQVKVLARIAAIRERREPTAEYLVTAANALPELVKALQRIRTLSAYVECVHIEQGVFGEINAITGAALALVEETK